MSNGRSKSASLSPAKAKLTNDEPSAGIGHLISVIKKELKSRGSGGFVGLQRRFKIMDDDGSKNLSFSEFKKALNEFKMNLSEADLRGLFEHFDSDGSGSIDFEEFVQGVRDPLSERRLKLVGQAFKIIDRDGSGMVDAQEMATMYDTSKHPEVSAGRKTPKQVLTEFLDTFDVGGVKDGVVTKQEFINYYANLGASIDNEDYFELMIRNAWRMSSGEGAAANTANMRVLVTDSRGIERTVGLENSLGLKNDDINGLYKRLVEQGEKDIRGINGKALQFANVNGVEVATVGGKVSSLEAMDFKLPTLDRLPRVKGSPAAAAKAQGALVPLAAAVASGSNSNSNSGSPARSNVIFDARPECAKPLSPVKKLLEQHKQEQQQQLVADTLLDVLRVQLLSRGAAGIIELQRKFIDMDIDGSKSLDYAEFKQAVLLNKLVFSEQQLRSLFSYFGELY